jgi:putative endonuclease
VTNDIVRRGYEHRTKAAQGFTKRYSVDKLVWFEIYDDAISAIAREKELKKWRRDWKIRLIEEENQEWVVSISAFQADIVVMDSGPAPRCVPEQLWIYFDPSFRSDAKRRTRNP